MFGNLGMPELILIFIVALLVFGPKRIPEIARQIGRWVGEFRRMANEIQTSFEREIYEMEHPSPPAQNSSSTPSGPSDVIEASPIPTDENDQTEDKSDKEKPSDNPETAPSTDAHEDLQWDEAHR